VSGASGTLTSPRRQLVLDALGMSISAGAFGIVYGLAARGAGFSLGDALAMSLLVLGGASQFAAVGLVATGVPWGAIVLLTAFLNARHLLYSAALAPWLRRERPIQRAAMAHVLTDETFALALAHFRRIGSSDRVAYWIAAAFVCLPWIAATVVGHLGGERIPEPRRLGLDVVFPAAMAGLAVVLVTGRRELLAAVAGAGLAVAAGLLWGPALGVVLAGLLAPLIALPLRDRVDRAPSVPA
jgi:4-azaleucine resistance transporter AzlC